MKVSFHVRFMLDHLILRILKLKIPSTCSKVITEMIERLQAALLGLLLSTEGYHVRFFLKELMLLSRGILTVSPSEISQLNSQKGKLRLFAGNK